MVTLVAPQPLTRVVYGSITNVSEMKGSALSMPMESSNRLALITPSLFPRDAPISSPSPISMEIQEPNTLSVTKPEVKVTSEDAVMPEEESEGSYSSRNPKQITSCSFFFLQRHSPLGFVPLLFNPIDSPPSSPKSTRNTTMEKAHPRVRVNKFVRRLHDMLQAEKNSGIVEWRRGLLVLHSTDAFTKTILPRYFNTKNFKTLRRQLNYYGFVHGTSMKG